MGEPDRLQSMRSQRVGHNRATSLSLQTFYRVFHVSYTPFCIFVFFSCHGFICIFFTDLSPKSIETLFCCVWAGIQALYWILNFSYNIFSSRILIRHFPFHSLNRFKGSGEIYHSFIFLNILMILFKALIWYLQYLSQYMGPSVFYNLVLFFQACLMISYWMLVWKKNCRSSGWYELSPWKVFYFYYSR